MIHDPLCAKSTRGPTLAAQGVLGALVLAGLLTACGTAGEPGANAGGSPSAAASAGADAAGRADPGDRDGTKDAADDNPAVELDSPVEVRAADLPSAEPVGTDAPQVERIAAVLDAHETFVPSDPPAAEGSRPPGADGSPGLDPAAVAAAEDSADGDALQEIVASLTEFEHQGWEQRGTPAIVGSPVLAPLPAEDGEAVRVTVCLDSSRVTVVDRDGNVVRGPEKDRRALHNYDLVRHPGRSWQVVQHGFPGDPTC